MIVSTPISSSSSMASTASGLMSSPTVITPRTLPRQLMTKGVPPPMAATAIRSSRADMSRGRHRLASTNRFSTSPSDVTTGSSAWPMNAPSSSISTWCTSIQWGTSPPGSVSRETRQARTMAAETGWSLSIIRAPATRRISSGFSSSTAATCRTCISPAVSVPTRLNITESALASDRNASASRMSSPLSAADRMPMRSAVDVDMASATGAMPMRMASATAKAPPAPPETSHQMPNATSASSIDQGTSTDAERTATWWAASSSRIAACTQRWIAAARVFDPVRATRTFRRWSRFREPAHTRELTFVSLGTGPPPTTRESTRDAPPTTTPSTGMICPGGTSTSSPMLSSAMGTRRFSGFEALPALRTTVT